MITFWGSLNPVAFLKITGVLLIIFLIVYNFCPMAKIQSYSQTSKYDHRRMITRTAFYGKFQTYYTI